MYTLVIYFCFVSRQKLMELRYTNKIVKKFCYHRFRYCVSIYAKHKKEIFGYR